MNLLPNSERYCDMEISELTKIIINRIQKVEPDNVIKIIGCIFLKEPSEQDMIQLAFGPESTILSKIADSKAMLNILTLKSSPSLSQMQSTAFHQYASSLQSLDFVLEDDYSLRNQTQFLSMDDQLEAPNQMSNYFYQDVGLGSRTNRRSPSLPEFPIKVCHYFYKGYCKHGANCRYFHGPSVLDGYNSQIYSLNMNELGNEDNVFSAGSLEKLEMEITELLRLRRGVPVSIASLPMLYYEKYGRNLQAEGYLTESQRHGKAGFSLTKLLARLRNSIRLIDRPHGQHSVILAEDAPRYMECRNERADHGPGAASSHQIYLTFPAESIFTEEDVSNYFKQFGPVRDVRIPSQEKRMFGFVSFVCQETVNMILVKRNPHYICGARVLVKPYREKSRIIDRSYVERIKPTMYYPSHYLEMDSEINSMPREFGSSNSLRQCLIEAEEKMLRLEKMRLSELNLAKPNNQQPFFSLSEGSSEFSLMEHFTYTFDFLNNNSTNDDNARHTSNSCSDQESQIDLPDSPFASPRIGSSISAVN